MTPEDNELLTQVGPGTPGGELFRRYWHPVALLPEISEDNPTTFIRMLGEDLVLFRDKSGRVGLISDHCPHRGASLLYGRVEERGIACAYHGWLYDVSGNFPWLVATWTYYPLRMDQMTALLQRYRPSNLLAKWVERCDCREELGHISR